MKQVPFWTVIKQTKRKYILHPYKANVAQKLNDANRQAGHNFVNWYLLCVCDGEIDPHIILISITIGFHSVCVCVCVCLRVFVVCQV